MLHEQRGKDVEAEILKLKVELLCRGARLGTKIDRGRKVGAGPAGGRCIILPGGSCVNTPLWGDFVKESKLVLIKRGDEWGLLKGDNLEAEVELVPYPRFYSQKTSDGVPMWKVALLHGKDCLATTVYQKCVYWDTGKKCKFCGIELSLNADKTIAIKKPKQFCEVVEAAVEEGVCGHITLTTGTTASRDRGAKLLAEVVGEVKAYKEIPVHVQLEPPKNSRYLELLAENGADTIGIHVESFDQRVLKEVCPGKVKTEIEKYFEAWRHSVELFGEGQVSSFIIAGLGEDDESILKGSEELARIGVIPYLVPLRPIIGTEFENRWPPSPLRMIRLYEGIANILIRYGLDPRKSKAGCVRCGGCSALSEAFAQHHH
ncbi:MAG: biotin synthase [Candidatus Bathyarchaeota archaeon BA2]|nr:MAG: biotin synthase [Candidatus Bathyarchaeota archaeon BA2]